MRKGRDGEKKMENGKKNIGENSSPLLVASQLPNGDRLQSQPLVPK